MGAEGKLHVTAQLSVNDNFAVAQLLSALLCSLLLLTESYS